MTREIQLQYCRSCIHREMDITQGLLCKLSGAKANFTDKCNDYKKDAWAIGLVTEDTKGNSTIASQKRITAEFYEKLRLEQNLPLAIIIGLAASIIGAILWAMITVSTNFQIGFMAIAVGAMVGYSIKVFGKGIDPVFGYLGAGLAFLGCILGNFFSIIGFVAQQEGLGYIETLLLIDYNLVPDIMVETFSFIDLIFYGIALYEGYKFSFRNITQEDLTKLMNNQ